VLAFRKGAAVKKANVFCSGRLEGQVLEVLVRRLRRGTATCAWRLPAAAAGKTVSATVVVQLGKARAEARFRTIVETG
jgi:hypothetical protein